MNMERLVTKDVEGYIQKVWREYWRKVLRVLMETGMV